MVELLIVPIGKFAGLVVGKAISRRLFVREAFGNHAWKLIPAELFRGLVARVTGNDDVIAVNDDGGLRAKGAQGSRNLVNGIVVFPGIVLIGLDVLERQIHHLLFLHDSSLLFLRLGIQLDKSVRELLDGECAVRLSPFAVGIVRFALIINFSDGAIFEVI